MVKSFNLVTPGLLLQELTAPLRQNFDVNGFLGTAIDQTYFILIDDKGLRSWARLEYYTNL